MGRSFWKVALKSYKEALSSLSTGGRDHLTDVISDLVMWSGRFKHLGGWSFISGPPSCSTESSGHLLKGGILATLRCFKLLDLGWGLIIEFLVNIKSICRVGVVVVV